MRGELRVVPDVAEAFTGVVRQRRPRTLALSGGETARRCYTHLAGFEDLDWQHTEVLIGDERWVPVDHPDSNEGMARQALLDHVPVAAVHSVWSAADDVRAAAVIYDRIVADIDQIDLVHLGLGEDGHTASLFPGSPALDERERLVVATGDQAHVHPRVTLTFPGLARARLALFTVSGAAKRGALDRVRAGEDVPAARVNAQEVIWLVDRAAAGASADVV